MSSLLCSFCGFELDNSSISDCDSVQSCPHCGSVLEEEQVFRHDPGSHDFSGSFANADGSQRYGHGFNNQLGARLPTNDMSAGKKKLKRLICSVCSKLQLPSEITEQTERFVLDEVNENYRFKMSRAKFRMVGSCVYIVCRKNNLPVTLGQIALACGCSHYAIGDYLKVIDREFNLHQAPVTVQNLIPVACSYLSKPKECEEIALQLSEQSSSAMVLKSMPLPQAIAHSVIASLALNKGTKQLAEVKKLCEKMSQEAESTVVGCINILKRYMMKLLEEIPWINMKYVKITNVHFYVTDIVKYRRNVGAFAANSNSPSWFCKKEMKIVDRKRKINNAQERIRLKESGDHEKNAEACRNENKLADNVEEGASKSVEDLCGAAKTDELDEEDKTIEDLLERGCLPKDLEEGYYECVKSTLPTQCDIQEHEIESYVRTPEEVQKLKRIADKTDADSTALIKKRRF